MIVIAALTFAISSATFKADAAMPKTTVYNKMGCTGSNRSPELQWQGAPHGTRSFAIVMHDPDAPVPGGWYHWVVMNLPATTHQLPEAVKLPASELGKSSFGFGPYGGPCPPAGKPHHYNFTIYALDVPSLSKDPLTGPEVEKAVVGHTLARATLTGLYGQ